MLQECQRRRILPKNLTGFPPVWKSWKSHGISAYFGIISGNSVKIVVKKLKFKKTKKNGKIKKIEILEIKNVENMKMKNNWVMEISLKRHGISAYFCIISGNSVKIVVKKLKFEKN
jgi:hypothetical protein